MANFKILTNQQNLPDEENYTFHSTFLSFLQ